MDKVYLAQKIKQLRLAHGWTLNELAAKLGGIVTKQSISKYEQGKSFPSSRVLIKIAHTFNIKASELISKPRFQINFIAYRKSCGLGVRDQENIENFAKERFEERLCLQDLVDNNLKIVVPIQKYQVAKVEDVEEHANILRKLWNIGSDEISSVTSLLENNSIHVIKIEGHKNFDGLSAIAYSNSKVKGAGIVIKKGQDGERQRMNLVHELGHIVLKVENLNEKDEEKAAFRFGAAFLAPKKLIFKEIGEKRTKLNIKELFILKERIGMSIQAIIYRLKDLEVISESYYGHCFRMINSWGWRKQEPNRLPEEKTEWLNQNVYKALAEGLITKEKAEILLNERLDEKDVLTLQRKKSFMELSLEERKRILAEQANMIADIYKENKSSREYWQGGDIIEQ